MGTGGTGGRAGSGGQPGNGRSGGKLGNGSSGGKPGNGGNCGKPGIPGKPGHVDGCATSPLVEAAAVFSDASSPAVAAGLTTWTLIASNGCSVAATRAKARNDTARMHLDGAIFCMWRLAFCFCVVEDMQGGDRFI